MWKLLRMYIDACFGCLKLTFKTPDHFAVNYHRSTPANGSSPPTTRRDPANRAESTGHRDAQAGARALARAFPARQSSSPNPSSSIRQSSSCATLFRTTPDAAAATKTSEAEHAPCSSAAKGPACRSAAHTAHHQHGGRDAEPEQRLAASSRCSSRRCWHTSACGCWCGSAKHQAPSIHLAIPASVRSNRPCLVSSSGRRPPVCSRRGCKRCHLDLPPGRQTWRCAHSRSRAVLFVWLDCGVGWQWQPWRAARRSRDARTLSRGCPLDDAIDSENARATPWTCLDDSS